MGNGRTQCVEQQTLKPVVVQRPESIWNIEPMMHGMECAVQILVGVEVSVQEVLPSINDEAIDMNGGDSQDDPDGSETVGPERKKSCAYMANRNWTAGMSHQ